MGLMFSRRRAEAAKAVSANKSKAHAENHRRAKIAAAAGVHPAKIQEQEHIARQAELDKAKEAPHGADASGTE